MYLTDKAIFQLVKNAGIVDPFNLDNLQPCSYDLTLGKTFLRMPETNDPLDPTVPDADRYIKDTLKDGQDFLIMPGEFVLATTVEEVNLPKDVAGQVQGKSSIGRLGLFIHNAGHIDPGFRGQITLELYNAGSRPIKLNYIERICQIVFTTTTGSVSKPYSGKYQEQKGVTGSRSEWEYTTPPNCKGDF